jgi:hypothetical protein
MGELPLLRLDSPATPAFPSPARDALCARNADRRRVAAAAYDRPHRESTPSGTVYAPVRLSPVWHRVLLCDAVLDAHAPAGLRKAIDDTLDLLRVVWVGLLLETDEVVQRRLDLAHAAIQHELAQAHLAWTRGLAEEHSIVHRLVSRREGQRRALAYPEPHGVGMAFPQQSRATEPHPPALRAATRALDAMVATIDVMRTYDVDAVGLAPLQTVLEHVGFAAVGAWRLGEIEGAQAAWMIEGQVSLVDAHFKRPHGLNRSAGRYA